ncbi:MAG: outer membrane beta-barrel protein [Muribaculaceae bacterium]|nr:outer membrane beta-barrel protein [Muribaculaceae bacterium]
MRQFLSTLMLLVAMAATATDFTGKVTDENGVAIEFATVSLLNSADSTFITGTTTAADGTFLIAAPANTAIVRVTYIGYQPVCVRTTGDVGTVTLQAETTLLGEVTVTAMRPTYRLTTEGLKTDVEGTLLSRVGSANEVLENLPGVQKKADGIEVFGKGAPLIYINGRELRNKSELDQIKSDNIQSVELITNPGAKYKAEVEAVILIKTKRPQGEGFSFDAQASYYQGESMDLATGVNWNYRHRGLDVFGAVWYNEDRWGQRSIIQFDVQADTTWFLDQRLNERSLARSLYNSVGVNYVLSDNHSMGVRYDTKWMFINRNTGDMTADVYADGAFYDHLFNTVEHKNKSNMPHTLNAYYNGRVGKTSIDANFDYMFYKDRKNQFNDEVSQERDSRIVTAQSVVRNQLVAGKLVLSWPVLGGNLMAGTELSRTRRNDDYVNPQHIVPSSFTEQRERGYAFFVEYTRPLSFGQLRLGLRNENVNSDYYSMGERIADQSRDYHHLFPTVGFTARAGAVQVMLNYAMKIQRPYYWQLNGAVSYGNRFTWESGNPALKPSINNQLGLMLMWKWMSLMVDYKHTTDHIVNVAKEVPGSEATTLLTRENLDHSDKLRLMLNLNPKWGIYEPQFSLGMIKDWTRIPTPIGFISSRRPIFLVQLNNNFRILPTLTACANLDITTKGDMENVSLLKAAFNLYLSVTKTFLNDRLSVKVAGHNLLDAQEQVRLCYGLRNMYQKMHRDSRELEVTVRYKFNAASSKWRGSGAGQSEKARMESGN